jgi:hypothetical protein
VGWSALLAGRDEEAVEYATHAAETTPPAPSQRLILRRPI